MILSFVISGFVVGSLIGLTGVGGGSLMTPLLTLLFGVPPSVAVGTDLAFASITKTTGVFAHKFRNSVDWRVVRLLCFGALPAALLSSIFLKHIGILNKEAGQIIRYTIASSIFLTIIALLFKSRLLAWLNKHPEKQLQGRTLSIATIFAGVILGSLVSISSIGAGAIGATLIVMLYPRLSAAEIAGTDIAYAVPLTAIAAIGHWWLGSIDWILLSTLLLGSIPGITLGALAAKAIPERMLRALLATTLTVVAAKLIF